MNTSPKFKMVSLKDLNPGDPFIFDHDKAVCIKTVPPPGETDERKALPWYIVLENGYINTPRRPEAMVYPLDGTFNWTMKEHK